MSYYIMYNFLQGTGVGTSDPALTSGFTKLVKNQTPDCATSDVPVCILVELSKKQPRSQHKARLMHNSTPEDILTKLHN